ncbi:unnamed protein product, partial [Symbiodinium pilosum]
VQHHGEAFEIHKKQCSDMVNEDFNRASPRRLQSWGTELADVSSQVPTLARELRPAGLIDPDDPQPTYRGFRLWG